MENRNQIFAWYKRHGGAKSPDAPLEEQIKMEEELGAIRDRIEDVLGELESAGFDFDAVLVTMSHVLHLMVQSATERDVSVILHKDAKKDLHLVPVAQEIIHSMIGDVIEHKRGMIERLVRSDGTTTHNPL